MREKGTAKVHREAKIPSSGCQEHDRVQGGWAGGKSGKKEHMNGSKGDGVEHEWEGDLVKDSDGGSFHRGN